MAPKKKYSRSSILNAAVEIVRENGAENQNETEKKKNRFSEHDDASESFVKGIDIPGTSDVFDYTIKHSYSKAGRKGKRQFGFFSKRGGIQKVFTQNTQTE